MNLEHFHGLGWSVTADDLGERADLGDGRVFALSPGTRTGWFLRYERNAARKLMKLVIRSRVF